MNRFQNYESAYPWTLLVIVFIYFYEFPALYIARIDGKLLPDITYNEVLTVRDHK